MPLILPSPDVSSSLHLSPIYVPISPPFHLCPLCPIGPPYPPCPPCPSCPPYLHHVSHFPYLSPIPPCPPHFSQFLSPPHILQLQTPLPISTAFTSPTSYPTSPQFFLLLPFPISSISTTCPHFSPMATIWHISHVFSMPPTTIFSPLCPSSLTHLPHVPSSPPSPHLSPMSPSHHVSHLTHMPPSLHDF